MWIELMPTADFLPTQKCIEWKLFVKHLQNNFKTCESCLYQRLPSYTEVHWEEIIGMEDLEQTLHVNVKSEIIFKLFGKIIRKWFENKWEMNFGNKLVMFFRNYLDEKLCMGSMRRQPEYQIPKIILSVVLTKTCN